MRGPGRAAGPAVVLLLVGLIGCGGGAPASTPLVLWAMGREGEVVARLVPEFERRHPEVRVRVQQIPWSAAHEKLITAFVGDAMPDVFQAGSTWLPELAALGAVEPLDERIARSAVVRREDYFPGIFETSVIGGTTYGVPWYVDTRVLFYRSDLFTAAGYPEPPRTWAAWAVALADVKARAGGEGVAVLLPIGEWEAPVIFALQLGADVLREGERWGNFRSPAVRAGCAFYLDLFQRGLAPRAAGTQIANVYHEFAAGAVASMLTGPWNLGEFARRLPVALAGRWATMPLPAPGGEWPGVSLAGGASLAIARGSARKEAAWRLVEYLSEPARQLDLQRLSGDLPARRSAWAAGDLARDPRVATFWTQLQAVRPLPRIPEWERIAARVGRYTEAAVRGDLTLDDALAALDRDVDALLAKRRWLLDRAG